jgi:hypothetical protein
MRMVRDRTLLKRWRYVGAYGPDLMLCAGVAHIGPLRQAFWAIATPDGRVRDRTALFASGGLRMAWPEVAIDAPGVRATVVVTERPAVETLSRHGRSYIWTAKQGGVAVDGMVELDGQPQRLTCAGVVDVSSGYHARHTVWSWSAGVGRTADGRSVAWNVVTGVHDAPENSERTVWVDGEPRETGPVEFAEDLSWIMGAGTELRFSEWSAREDRTNALVLRSWYRQPFGTFAGSVGGIDLAEGYGVMESHDVRW